MSLGQTRIQERPHGANSNETRLRIMRAACWVFHERGYEGATFQAIAARAGLTRPAVNHYFSSKCALYREVLGDTNELVIKAGIERAEGEATLTARLTAFIRAARHADSLNPAGFALLITGMLESQRHPDLAGTANESVRICRDFLMRVVKDGVERGEITVDIEASALVDVLLVVICGLALHAGYVQGHQETAAVTDILQRLLNGMFCRPDREDDIPAMTQRPEPSDA